MELSGEKTGLPTGQVDTFTIPPLPNMPVGFRARPSDMVGHFCLYFTGSDTFGVGHGGELGILRYNPKPGWWGRNQGEGLVQGRHCGIGERTFTGLVVGRPRIPVTAEPLTCWGTLASCFPFLCLFFPSCVSLPQVQNYAGRVDECERFLQF